MGTVTARSTDNEDYVPESTDLGYSFPRSGSVTVTATRNEFYELKYWIDEKGTKIFPDGTYQTASDDTPRQFTGGTSIDDIQFSSVSGLTNDKEYTVTFNLDRIFELQAVFGERESYKVNFMAGDAYGIALPVQHVEFDKKFNMPQGNYNLYKEGYTLQYYVNVDSVDFANAKHYEFGKSYLTTCDLRLMPVFTPNKKSVADVTDAAGRTVTWDISTMSYSFANSKGQMVAQLQVDDDNVIDVQCAFEKYGSEIYERTNTSGNLEVSKGAELSIIATKGSVFKVSAATGSEFAKGDFKIDGSSNDAGASYSKEISGNGVKVIAFDKVAEIQSVSVTYKKLDKEALLKSVTIGGTALTAEQLTSFNSTLAYAYSCAASVVYDNANAMPVVAATASDDDDVVTITQATPDSPVASILVSSGGVTLSTYTISFSLTSASAPALHAVKINSTEVEEGSTSVTQSASGVITLTFNHPMEAADVVSEALGQTLKGVSSDSILQLTYWSLEPSTSYTLTIPSTLTVADKGWNATDGISASGTLASGKKLTVTASSANSWALKQQDGNETVSYTMKETSDGAAKTAPAKNAIPKPTQILLIASLLLLVTFSYCTSRTHMHLS